MKKLGIILLLLLAFLSPTIGQEEMIAFEERVPPKDSLPDLWIVTIDMSGSMKKNVEQTKKKLIYQLVQEKVKNIMIANGAKPTDSMVFLKSGIDKTLLLSSIKDNETLSYFSTRRPDGTYPRYHHKEICFPTSFVRQLKGSLSLPKGMSYLKSLCADGTGFDASLSFTSLIRPLSIYILTKKGISFNEYDAIYHVLVTDDGDVNDQWNQDYKYLKKYTRPHFDTVCDILPKVACSNFDFASKQTAKFEEVCPPYDSTQPRIYLTQYITYQEKHPENKLKVESLVSVSDFHDNSLTFQMKPCGDSVKFVYVSTCHVNGHPVEVNQYLYLGDAITVGFDKAFVNTFQNKVAAEGTYQEQYNDRILGQRYRKVAFRGEISDTFVSSETKAAELRCLKVALALLLAIILFIIVWRNTVVLSIYVNRRSWSVKRKAMNRLKNGDYNVVTVQCDSEMREPGFWFLLGKGFLTKLEKSKSSRSKKHDGNELQIKSNRKLAHVSTEMVYDEDKNGKVYRFDFDDSNIGDEIHFSYSGRLSHNLIIKFIGRRKVEPVKWSDNLLRDYNLNMLAVYARNAFDVFEFPYKMVPKEKNHVQVNIIRKEVLGSTFNEDYAVLNIFDHNSCNSANRIFLRYSLACFFDHNQTTEQTVADRLIEVAHYVLKSEHQKASYIESKPYMKYDFEEQGLDVDVSPFLSYLYLLKKGQSRLVYSPFKDGCQPLSDGRQGLVRKTIKVFPNFSTTLLNLPFKYRHPEMKVNGPTKVAFEKCFHEAECMDFLGDDRIRFLGVEKDWTMGVAVGSVNGSTHRSWPLDVIIEDANKQK